MKKQISKKCIKDLVSIIIVNWNGKKYLETCLKSLYDQKYKNFEIIFVDNNSIDDSINYVKTNFPDIKIILNKKNYGFAKGNNIGLKYCNGEYLLLLNNDTEVHNDFICELVNSMDNEKIAGVCGKVYSLNKRDKKLSTIHKIDPSSGKAIHIIDEVEKREIDYLAGNSMLLKKTVIDKVGFFDSTYFAYYEETDLCARIIKAGYSLFYIPKAYIWHKEQGTATSSFHKYYIMRNQIRFVIKNFDLNFFPKAIIGNFISLINIISGKKQKTLTVKKDDKKFSVKLLLFKAIIWNLVFIPHTIYCRVVDNMKIGYLRVSYNKNLPLRDYKK
ncbi:MAG: glycosyltransferase family 2 protein [Clostridiales bacterium]